MRRVTCGSPLLSKKSYVEEGKTFSLQEIWEEKGPGGRVELEEGVLQGIVQLHNRGLHTVHN